MRFILAPFLAVVATLAALSPAQAATPRMPLGRATTAPIGYVEFCAARPAECREQTGRAPVEVSPLAAFWRQAFLSESTSAIAPAPIAPGGAHLTMTAETVGLLNAVNREVNTAITPAHDLADGRHGDIWSLPLLDGRRTGDCEDYVLEKRRALVAQGVDAEALSIAVVRTRSGESHAVLLVDTDAGELVLDNRSHWISAWTEADYRWVKRQAPGDLSSWVRIGAP